MFTSSYSSLYVGSTIRIERVSPEIIILRPPEKLVIEVRVSGDYQILSWNKDTSYLNRPEPQELSNFHETFVRDKTTAEDVGIYIVHPTISYLRSGVYTQIPIRVDFAVISPGRLSYNAVSKIVIINLNLLATYLL